MGPFTAIWFVSSSSLLPLVARSEAEGLALVRARQFPAPGPRLRTTLAGLPQRPALFRYLGRLDALPRRAERHLRLRWRLCDRGDGLHTVDIGIFGIVAAISGRDLRLGGRQGRQRLGVEAGDHRLLVILIAVGAGALSSRSAGLRHAGRRGPCRAEARPSSSVGAAIGAGAGAVQAASRTMLVHLANPEKMTESFGLYGSPGRPPLSSRPSSSPRHRDRPAASRSASRRSSRCSSLGLWLFLRVPNFRAPISGGPGVRASRALCLILTLGSPARRGRAPAATTLQRPSPRPRKARAEAIGSYAKGCAAGNVALPQTGPTWQAMRLEPRPQLGQPGNDLLSREPRAERSRSWAGGGSISATSATRAAGR